MKIVIATDSFKGSLDSLEVADCVEKGIKNVIKDAQIIKLPMADGGEGTVESLVKATKGRLIKASVTGPLLSKVEAFYGILGDNKTAVIEMSAASGLPLVPKYKRNPMITTTYGTGELIKIALDSGCREFIIGIGGSATNDGGAGMAQALGVKLLDKNNNEIEFGGEDLINVYKIDTSKLDKRILDSKFTVACDVDNPLCGPNGASFVYGPQKGATVDMIGLLDEGLKHFAKIIKRDLNKDIVNLKGAGAAGGLGGGLVAFLDAELKSGIDIVIDKINLRDIVKGADFVITGEGKIDSQTINGKTPIGVAKVAKQENIPVIALAGCVCEDAHIVHEYGIDSIFSIMNCPMSIEQALKKEKASILVEKKTEEIFRLINILEKNKVRGLK